MAWSGSGAGIENTREFGEISRVKWLSCVWLLKRIREHVFACTEELQKEKEKYKVVNTELDATFAELTGF